MKLIGKTIEDAVSGQWYALCFVQDYADGVELTAYRDNYRTRARALAYLSWLRVRRLFDPTLGHGRLLRLEVKVLSTEPLP